MPVANPATVYVPVPSIAWQESVITAPELRADVAGAVQILANPPAFSATSAFTQTSLPSSTATGVSLDTDIADSYNGHNPLALSHRYFPPVPGWYLGEASVPLDYSGGSGLAAAAIGLAPLGVGPDSRFGEAQANSGTASRFAFPTVARLVQCTKPGPVGTAGVDYFNLQGYQNTGATQLTNLNDSPQATFQWISGNFNQGPTGAPPAILNANWDFETNVSSWTGGNGATIAQTTAWGWRGNGSMLLTPDGVTSNPFTSSENTVPVAAGSTYTAASQVFIPFGWSQVLIKITYLAAGGGTTGTFQATFNVPQNQPNGTLVTVTGLAPATSTRAQITGQLLGTPASQVVAYFDTFHLALGTVPNSGIHGLIVPTNDTWPTPPTVMTHQFVNKNIRDTIRFYCQPPIMEAATASTSTTFASQATQPALGGTVKLDTITVDSYTAFSLTTWTYTVPVAGRYYLYGLFGINAAATAVSLSGGLNITSSLYNGGTPFTMWGAARLPNTGGAALNAAAVRRQLSFNAGDTISLGGWYQDSAAASATTQTGLTVLAPCRLIVVRVSN